MSSAGARATLGVNGWEVPPIVGGPVVMVTDIDTTGLTNSSAAFIAAADKIPSGGTVVPPPGAYLMDGLPFRNALHWQGQGRDASNIIVAGNDHIFKAGAGDLESGGVSGFSALGNAANDTSFDGTFDFINLTAASSAFQLFIAENYATRFRSCYRGSQDDREPRLHNNSFWNSRQGLYIINNHPLLTGVNDIRACEDGITGENIYDMNIVGQKITYCQRGMTPQSGFTIQNTQLIGCVIGFNILIGLQLHKGCSMQGGQLLAHSATANARGVVITGAASVIGVEVQSFGAPWTVAAICLNYSTGSGIIGAEVSGNAFAGNGSRIGTAILHESGSIPIYMSTFDRNRHKILNAADRFMHFAGTGLLYSSINGNKVDGQVSNTNAVIEASVSGTFGNTIKDNIINQAGGSAYAINARCPATQAKGNIARRGGGYNWTNADARTNGEGVGAVTAADNIYSP